MNYILIIILALTYQGPGKAVSTHSVEFESLTQCEEARDRILKENQYDKEIVFCIAKDNEVEKAFKF